MILMLMTTLAALVIISRASYEYGKAEARREFQNNKPYLKNQKPRVFR